jgi:hypothetical protein
MGRQVLTSWELGVLLVSQMDPEQKNDIEAHQEETEL